MSGALAQVERDLKAEFDRYHLRTQVLRFVGLFATVLGAQLLGGATVTGWADLWSLLAGVAGVAWRQWVKTAPQSMALGVVRDARAEHESAQAITPAPRD